MPPKIWVVDNEYSQYEKMRDLIREKGYEVYPDDMASWREVIALCQLVGKAASESISPVSDPTQADLPSTVELVDRLRLLLETHPPILIVVDVSLKDDRDDLGIQLLTPLRRLVEYVPILVISIHTQGEVVEHLGGSKQPTFYLNKRGRDGELLSPTFLKREFSAVVDTLVYWYDAVGSRYDLQTAVYEKLDSLQKMLASTHGLLELNFAAISKNMNDLVTMTNVLVRMVQYQIGHDDTRAKKVVDDFLNEFDVVTTGVEELKMKKAKIREVLRSCKDEMAKALKGEVPKDLLDIAKESIAELAGIEDDKLTRLVAKSLWKAIGAGWRFYRTGIV